MRTARSLTVSDGEGGLPPSGCRPTPWTEGMTNACENITLPQTSFAGGNEYFYSGSYV